MIRCKLATSRGMLSAFESTGHDLIDKRLPGGKWSQGSIPCAAVSTLIRSAGKQLELSEMVIIELDRFEAGDVKLRVVLVEEKAEAWLRGLTDVLAQGLEDVERDFPDQMAFDRIVEED